MLKETIMLTVLFLATSFLAVGQTPQGDTLEFDAKSHLFIFNKGQAFNSTLIILDSLTKDTVEFVQQVSQNRSISIVYENNKPKYRAVCKAFYDKKAKKMRKEERHIRFINSLPRKILFYRRRTLMYPAYYYGKSGKIKSMKKLENGVWKNTNDKTKTPIFCVFYDRLYQYRIAGNIERAKF